MANGYLLIKKTDIYENNGVTYWKNGANIIGNVVKCVDSDEAEHYYIESLKTRKAILLDDDVKIGGGDFGFESTNGNFILVTTDEVDFSDIGGGDGVSITFTFGNKYYTVTLPEDNGDLKIYDPDGEGGKTGADPLPDVTDASAGDVLALDENKIPVWTTGGGENYYLHQIRLSFNNTPSSGAAQFEIISTDSEPYTRDTFFGFLVQIGNPSLDCHGAIYNSNSLIWSCKYTPSTLKVQFYILALTISGTDIHIDQGTGPAINLSNLAVNDYVVKSKIGT